MYVRHLQLFVVRPAWHDLTSEGRLDYAYDRGAAVFAMTVGIACVIAARELYRRRQQPTAS